MQYAQCKADIAQPITLGREFRIIPAGQFRAMDGRPGAGKYWDLSAETGARLVAEAAARPTDYLIDYEHQSMAPATQAPAAGWFHTLMWKPDGLYVTDPKWTDAARAMIAANEYRFISPVFTYDPTTLEVQSLVSVALTNVPALPELTDLSKVALRATASVPGNPNNPVLVEIARNVGVSAQALAASVASQAQAVALSQQANAAEFGEVAKIARNMGLPVEALRAAIASNAQAVALSQQANGASGDEVSKIAQQMGLPVEALRAAIAPHAQTAALNSNPRPKTADSEHSREFFQRVFGRPLPG